MARYKFLKQLNPPENIPESMFDLVDGNTFIKPDGRIPLLPLTEYGLWCKHDANEYDRWNESEFFNAMLYQVVGFIGRQYSTGRDLNGILEFYLDQNVIYRIQTKCIELWEELQFMKVGSLQNRGFKGHNQLIINDSYMLSNQSAVFCAAYKSKYIHQYGKVQVFILHACSVHVS
jgi:hypothetical protein